MKRRMLLSALCALVLSVLGAPAALAGPTAILAGGDTVSVGGTLCRIAFTVRLSGGGTGLITTPPCAGSTGQAGIIPTPAGNTAVNGIRNGGVIMPLHSTTPTPVGGQVCLVSPVSGVVCGVVQAVNQTVNFGGVVVTGLTRTSICAGSGATGAPVFTSDRAQGIAVGGSGSCTTGGTTFFQPINQVLSAYVASLLL